jgi:hypothetical protein
MVSVKWMAELTFATTPMRNLVAPFCSSWDNARGKPLMLVE